MKRIAAVLASVLGAYLGFRVAFSIVWHVGVHRQGLRFQSEVIKEQRRVLRDGL